MRKKKAHKIVRYVKVNKKMLRKLTPKRAAAWINHKLKQHPLILGVLFAVWLNHLVRLFFYPMETGELLMFHVKFILLLALAWVILVSISGSLKDRKKVKWYLKKRVVFVALILLPPLGLILLWMGSKFKETTKVVLTVVFFALFVVHTVYRGKMEKKIINMSALDRMTEMIAKPKGKSLLKNADAGVLAGLKLLRLSSKEKIKLPVAEIYSLYSSSIVSIKTKNKEDDELGSGSGFVVSQDGFIVTNAHVIKGAYQLELKINGKAFNDATLVKNIQELDIAILKVNAQDLKPLYIGNSDGLSGGELIVALGNPMGFEQSVSSGIVSAVRTNRQMKVIQITAPLSPGSSGGPLLNEYGEVVGITTLASFFMAQNLNFAVPINYLDKAIEKQ
jgi:hypothetical protein